MIDIWRPKKMNYKFEFDIDTDIKINDQTKKNLEWKIADVLFGTPRLQNIQNFKIIDTEKLKTRLEIAEQLIDSLVFNGVMTEKEAKIITKAINRE